MMRQPSASKRENLTKVLNSVRGTRKVLVHYNRLIQDYNSRIKEVERKYCT